jgi:hypothetical protein
LVPPKPKGMDFSLKKCLLRQFLESDAGIYLIWLFYNQKSLKTLKKPKERYLLVVSMHLFIVHQKSPETLVKVK